MRLRLNYAVILLLLLATKIGFADGFLEAFVDRNILQEGEVLNLRIVATDISDRHIDTSELEENFWVVNTQVSQSYVRTNLQTEKKTTWHIRLKPKSIGQATIPSLKVDKYKTQPIPIEVKERSQAGKPKEGDPIFIESVLETSEPLLNSETRYIAKVYIREDITPNGLSLTSPKHDTVQVYENHDEKMSQVYIKGQRYQVVERQYFFYPRESGEVAISPPVLEGYYYKGAQGTRRLPGFGFFTEQYPEMVHVAPETIQLNVKPLPESKPGVFPARKVALKELSSLPQAPLKEGEPILREVLIEVEGFPSADLPPLTINLENVQVFIDQIKQEDEVTQNGVKGYRHYKITYLPNKSGEISLPGIQIPWWNTQTRALEVAELPEIQLQVLPAPNLSSVPLLSVPQSQDAVIESKINYHQKENPWIWSTILLAVAMLYTQRQSLLCLLKRNGSQNNVSEIKKRYFKAFEEKEYRDMAHELLSLEKIMAHHKRTPTLSELAEKYQDKERLSSLLKSLDRMIYGQSNNPIEGEVLWDELQKTLRDKADSSQTCQEDSLPKLNP